MYYEESTSLITHDPRHKKAIIALDRLIARAYAADHLGYIELALLANQAGEPAASIMHLMLSYETAKIVRCYEKLLCTCGEAYDPDDGHCLSCKADISEATKTNIVCYAVLLPPLRPAFDPNLQSTTPEVFISYRRSDSHILAADLFYMLQSYGKSIFLDDSSIPPGDDAERDFLRAASHAPYFICLISKNYFDSDFCKKEIAHAARSNRRMIRVNISPTPHAPPDMPWVDGPNWLQQRGNEAGLDQELENSVMAGLNTLSTGSMDQRKQACQYLLSIKSPGEIRDLWNRLPWVYETYQPTNSRNDNIGLILQETTTARLAELCRALAP